MAASPVEVVRGVYERWATGDFTTEDVFAADAVLVMPPDLPDTGSYTGLEGIASYTRQFLEPWERITIEAETITETGDGVVLVDVLQRGTGSGSGAEAELRYGHVWTISDGRATRLEAFRERTDAAAAAGA